MTRHPITIDPDAPVGTAIAVMSEREIRHLPVADGAGRLVGMLSDRDLRGVIVAPAVGERVSAAGRRRLRGLADAVEALRVRDVMTWNVVTADARASVAEAAAVMFHRQLGSLPVVERGRLVGIVTERDVLRAMAATVPAVKGGDPDGFLW